MSRRALLGLGAVAGAAAGGVVGGISANAWKPERQVEISGAAADAFVATSRQDLSPQEQQQAVTNLGTVRIVEPEQFPGATDELQFAGAVAALAETGGVIRLRPGKVYQWSAPVPSVDWTKHAPLVVSAWGSSVQYSGSGTAFTSMQTSMPAGLRTLTVLGGDWEAPKADSFFLIQDSGNHFFSRTRVSVPNGAGFEVRSVRFWCERNHFVGVEDANSREVIRFTSVGRSSSFARTLVRDLRLQGGVAGYAKINVVEDGDVAPNVYDSTFDGITGNVANGVIIQRLAGGMGGTRLSRFQVETRDGTPAAYWDVGTMRGSHPLLVDGPPSLRNIDLFTSKSSSTTPFGPHWSPGGITVDGAVTHGMYSASVTRPGSVTIPRGDCNVAVVALSAKCTGTTISSAPDRVSGPITQLLTIVFVQDLLGGHDYAWPDNCRFAHGAAPTDTTPATQTSVTFMFRAGVWYEVARAVAVPA